MKTVAITGPRAAALKEVPQPQIRGEFVLVKIHSAPMCTEFKSFLQGDHGDCLGHEAAGEVVEVAQPGRVKVGDRVVVMPQFACGRCDLCLDGHYIHCEDQLHPLEVCASETGIATYAEFLIKPDWLLLPIPDDISYDHAAMACCGLGPTFGAMELMGVGQGDIVLISGLGPVGLGGVINGVARGARVIGMESNPFRTRLARELGAEAIFDPRDPEALRQIRDFCGGKGADKAIDCTGLTVSQQFLLAAVRRRGHITFVGWGGGFAAGNMVPGGLTLQGSWHWNSRHSGRMMRLIRDQGPKLDQLITHRFPMSQVREAFEVQASGECGKVVLHPWE